MSKHHANHLVVSENGPLCVRCARPTQVREHEQISEKMLRQPFYYSRWYFCMNESCRTKQIMPPEFIVWNKEEDRRLAAIKAQLTPPV
jgi:hypothetical protein